MARALSNFVDRLMQRGGIWLKTVVISTSITAVVLIADWLINVVLAPGVTPYTPLGTLAIVVLIAPPCVFALLRQADQVRKAHSLLADEQASRAALEAAASARNTFLANLSHELRTPLNGVIGYTELMLETAREEAREGDAADHARVLALSQRLLRLLNDLLDLAKVEANRMTLTPAPYEVRTLLEEAIAVVQPDIERNRNSVSLHVAGDVTTGCADPHRLSQCVLNLLSNAAKFTADGEIVVRAERVLAEGEQWLVIGVRDTGVGIEPARQVVLFEPFLQADSSSALHGTGLGLAITRQLSRLMGGDVSVRSAPNAGSHFSLRIPLHARMDAPIALGARAA